VVVGVLLSRSRQQESRRAEAAELRNPTADHQMELREKEAAAAASEAEARRVRAEADQRAAQAQHLEVQAQRASLDRDSAAETNAEQLRRADALDPDVRTDKEGNRLDRDGDGDVEGDRLEAPRGERTERAASGLGASTTGLEHSAGRADGGTDQTAGGRIGNMRGLDDEPGEPGVDTHHDHDHDHDHDRDGDPDRDRTALDGARDGADEVIDRRDAEGRRDRQPE
jgi:hypothetical protein